ncbi:unnamed protein product [Brachionus calyciflorus]|uniref:TTF-type domain-containing protein n=1 Tax=Brachionus calyciflorus TaxID=104777 RepID=A0A814QQN1_9BILA|nr:unnamed protein product [Brachionus calyciflorus]
MKQTILNFTSSKISKDHLQNINSFENIDSFQRDTNQLNEDSHLNKRSYTYSNRITSSILITKNFSALNIKNPVTLSNMSFNNSTGSNSTVSDSYTTSNHPNNLSSSNLNSRKILKLSDKKTDFDSCHLNETYSNIPSNLKTCHSKISKSYSNYSVKNNIPNFDFYIVEENILPNQPTDFEPPKDKYNLTFRIEWYRDFKWLEYDVLKDRAFCFYCKKFNAKGAKNDCFVTIGFQTWKNALNRFKEHERTYVHQHSSFLFNQAIKKMPSCASLINNQHTTEVQFNRNCLSKIIKVIMLLGKQGLAFRGHRETESEENKGNFLEIIGHVAKEYSSDLKKFINNRGNANYLSHDIQSELMAIVSNQIRENITNRVKKNKYFSIIVDGTSDITRKEQISFCIRTVSKNLEIEESFLGFYEAKDT